MKYSLKAWVIGHIIHCACKKEYAKRGITQKVLANIVTEHKRITVRAKDMNDEKLLSSYIMGIHQCIADLWCIEMPDAAHAGQCIPAGIHKRSDEREHGDLVCHNDDLPE